ncbi:hypothetical protein ACFP7A_03910 [Sporolactobacillus kofuensis]|uniref:Uncharacterized protein n=2 Tax=Sporolactobacillus kofuensis TaxID=269672 RepID=A0ABW1WCA1_9BACL
MQILMLWFLPIYILIMVSEYYIQDVQSNSQSIHILKVGKRKYFGRQLIFSFIVAFSVMLISLLINFLLVWLINYNGTQDPYTAALPQLSKIINQHPEFMYSYFIIANQTLANLIFILLVSVIVGVLGSGLTAICFFFPKRVYAYFLAFALWFLDITGDHAVMIVFQPFNEYPWKLVLTNIGLFLSPAFILIVASYIYKVKSDEI